MREFIHAPTHVGSVCPSSKALTKALTEAVPFQQDGLIIDLGAGSGIVTEELLRSGISPKRILGVEISPGFRNIFMQRCPGVPLVIGDARRLTDILAQYAKEQQVCAVISSLPFRVMSATETADILKEVKKVMLQSGGILIQYTYALWTTFPLRKHGFAPYATQRVLSNIPPAKVDCYSVLPS